MTRLALSDGLLDGQLLRTVGTAPWGGADVGECLAVARRVRGTNLTSWHVAWTDLAETTTRLAEEELAAGRVETARAAFLRGANYHRTAGVMFMDAPLGNRLRSSNAAQTEAFRRGFALLERPPETVTIPFEETTLPGYLFRAGEDVAPTLILLGGYDGTAEELYLLTAAAALARGYHVLAFDGPGQGSALVQQGLVLRADFGPVVGAAIDFLLDRPGVDPDRIALMGLSLGGFLAPRAAATERRIAACVADCGSYDLYASALARMPRPVANGLREDAGWARGIAERLMGSVARKPTAGWALRRGMLVHGAASPLAYLDALREYTLAGYAEKITCPTLVCQAEGDAISASAPQLVAQLQCPHRLVRFTALEGAGDHCEAGARTLFHARAFGWLDDQLT